MFLLGKTTIVDEKIGQEYDKVETRKDGKFTVRPELMFFMVQTP